MHNQDYTFIVKHPKDNLTRVFFFLIAFLILSMAVLNYFSYGNLLPVELFLLALGSLIFSGYNKVYEFGKRDTACYVSLFGFRIFQLDCVAGTINEVVVKNSGGGTFKKNCIDIHLITEQGKSLVVTKQALFKTWRGFIENVEFHLNLISNKDRGAKV